MIHIYNDGSILKVISSRELVAIPIWKGNRILDESHANEIKKAIGDNIKCLDSGYSIIKYHQVCQDGTVILSSYLIDGQHRAYIIRDYYNSTICEPDFQVTVREKTVESELDAIEYYNTINNIKQQHWLVDTNLLINIYIAELEKRFNKNKKCLLIRPDRTSRPYLSACKLRDIFNDNKKYLKQSKNDIYKFAEAVNSYNTKLIKDFELELTLDNTIDKKEKSRALDAKFILAYDTKLKWVREILESM